MTAPSLSDVVSAWHGIGQRHQLGGSGGKATVTLSGCGTGGASHLLLDSATEVLLDELPAGGCLQLQVTLQSLEWHIFMSTYAHAAAGHPETVRCGFAIGSAGAMELERGAHRKTPRQSTRWSALEV